MTCDFRKMGEKGYDMFNEHMLKKNLFNFVVNCSISCEVFMFGCEANIAYSVFLACV